jgi:predicted transcriptional regulator
MPRTIKVDDDVWQALSNLAEPLVDSPNSVLRRVLLDSAQFDSGTLVRDSTSGTRRRNRRGELLPETEYFLPILRALDERGGRAPTREVLDAVGKQVKDRLTSGDLEPTGNGNEVRWEMRVHFARLRMKERGLIESTSPRGTWEISTAGRKYLTAA